MAFGLEFILPALSAVVGAVGAIASGESQAAAAEYNAKVQDQNAKVAMEQASAAGLQESKKTRQLVASASAGAEESGLTLTGSTKTVINQARDVGNMNQLLAIYDGSVAATGYRNNANLDRANARSSRVAGYFGAGSHILGGIGGAYRNAQLSV